MYALKLYAIKYIFCYWKPFFLILFQSIFEPIQSRQQVKYFWFT